MQLRGELRSGSRSNTAVPELKAEIDDLRRECQLLKDANTKIVSSAFNADREREFREKERALQLKIAQLEATMKADMNERGSLLDRITTERSKRFSFVSATKSSPSLRSSRHQTRLGGRTSANAFEIFGNEREIRRSSGENAILRTSSFSLRRGGENGRVRRWF